VPRISRLLAVAVAVLVVLDLIGGLIPIATDKSDFGEAWSFDTRYAVPWPIILFQVVLTAVAVIGRRFALAAALLLTVTCGVSVLSGLFDGDLLASGQIAFGLVLASWMALVGVLAALRTRELRRAARGLNASM
jgi:hypothetical protein